MTSYDGATGWYKSSDFWFNDVFEKNFEKIKEECYDVLNKKLFVPHGQSEENNTSKESKLAKKWDSFDFRVGDSWKDVEHLAPFTYNLLRSIRELNLQKRGKIYFSMIQANSEVIPHTSDLPVGTRSRHQLCIEGPEYDPELLYMDVLGTKRGWQVGKVFSFDDAYTHSVVNKTDKRRIVLIYDSI